MKIECCGGDCGNTGEGQLIQNWCSCSKELMLELVLRKMEMTLLVTELETECSRQEEQNKEGPEVLKNKMLRYYDLYKDSA